MPFLLLAAISAAVLLVVFRPSPQQVLGHGQILRDLPDDASGAKLIIGTARDLGMLTPDRFRLRQEDASIPAQDFCRLLEELQKRGYVVKSMNVLESIPVLLLGRI